MSDERDLYDDGHIGFLTLLWGEGFMSPGGPEEVARVLEGLDLTGKRVLDIGCGAGGIAALLARNYGVAEVVGIDVEGPVCASARALAEKHGVGDRVEIVQVEPGPFPFPDESFDIVFSKDSIIHIPNKEALAAEAFRVLRPGGWFAASDWLIAHDGEPSAEMARYIAAEDLDFAMASPARYEKALKDAGFTGIRLVNRNPWYAQVAREERARLVGPERPEFEKALGAEDIEEQVRVWDLMIPVLDSGEHCPHHLRGKKPD